MVFEKRRRHRHRAGRLTVGQIPAAAGKPDSV
jgi:hypothetical protein